METQRETLLYEKTLSVNLVYWINALQLVGALGIKTITDPQMIKHPRIEKGLAQIIQAIEICGHNLQRLPDPPTGGEDADRCFRDLGNAIVLLSNVLKDQGKPRPVERLSQDEKYLQDLVELMKQTSRRGLELYDAAFPGRFKSILAMLEA